MPERLGEAVLELRTDDRKFREGLKQAQTGASDLGRRFDQIGRSALRFGRNLAIGLGAAGAGLSLLFKRALDTADEIAKTAERIGLGTDALQELRFAADQTGVDIGQLDQALTALIRRQGEAIAGNKEFAKGFERVGLSVEELRRLTPEQLVRRVADGLSRIENQALRVAAADRIMSEAGRQVINVFDGGAESLGRFAARARDLGLVIDDPLLRNAERAKDQLSILAEIISTQLTTAVVQAAPQVQFLAEKIIDLLGRVNEFVRERRVGELRDEIKALETDLRNLNLRLLQTEDQWERHGLELLIERQTEALRKARAELERALGEAPTTPPPTPEAAGAAGGVGMEASFEALKRVEEARQALMEEGRRVTEAQRSATERLVDEQARLMRLLEAGAITWETYNRGLLAARDEFDQGTRAATDTITSIDALGEEVRQVDSAARELGFTFTSAFEDAIVEGRSLSEVLRALERDVLRILTREAISEPLAEGLDKLLTAGLAALPGLFASGPAAAPRPAHPGIPAFHRGGFVRDPGLILAKEREAIFTPHQMDNANRLFGAIASLAARGGGRQEVYVIDQRSSGAPAEVQRRRGPEGREVVEVIIRDAVGRALDRGGLDRALATNFGLRRDRTVR